MEQRKMPQLDISTPEARKQTLAWFDEHGWKNPWLAQYWLIWKVGKAINNTISSVLTNETEIEIQKKAAIDIIRAGKEHKVDELEITMDRKVGISLQGTIEGVPTELIIGQSGKMTLKVKYKD